MPRRKKNPKPVLHLTKHKRTVVGEYMLVKGRGGAKRFEVPLAMGEHMDSCNLYKKIALHHHCSEENILIEPGYYLVTNEVKDNPYYENPLDPEEDGYEYNQKGNLVKAQGNYQQKLREKKDGKK